MDAITMRSTHWILKQVKKDFPHIHFKPAQGFWWSAASATIYTDLEAEHNQEFTLHELSHALLGHNRYERDVELLKLERDAWEYAKNNLATKYKVFISENIIQDNLDTYRHWLHARSTCPECETIGVQTRERHYQCISCNHKWRVNEARLCSLRRYSMSTDQIK